MTFTDNPVWLDGANLSGAMMRRAEAMIMMSDGTAGGALGGVRPGDPGLLVSLSGMGISVAAGVAAVPYAGQGIYRAYNGTTWTGTVATAHASLTRIDLVYLRIWDNAVDSAGLAQADVVYLPGTAGSGVAPTPTAPQVYIALASINVPAGSTTPTVQDLRPVAVAPGGIAPSGSTPGYYIGQYRDNPAVYGGGLQRWDGSAWQPYAQILHARKVTDQSIAGTITLQNDAALTVNLGANMAYAIEAFIVYSTPAAADFKMGWSVPFLSNTTWSPWALSGDPSSDTGSIRAAATLNASPLTTTTATPNTTNLVARPVGTILTSNAGALTLQWGQALVDAGQTTVHANSWIRATRLPF